MDNFCDFRFAFPHTKLLLEKCLVKKKTQKKKKQKKKKTEKTTTKQQKTMLPVKAVSFKIDNLLEGK